MFRAPLRPPPPPQLYTIASMFFLSICLVDPKLTSPFWFMGRTLATLNREVTTDIFLTSSAAISTKSALFVAWGQLLTYDLSLTIDNSTEPFDVPCNDVVDVWCPLGVSSDEISFDRSDSGVAGSVRSPINYATAYIDLDFVYGRSEEEAEALRTLEGGTMNITASGVPFQNEDGTWLVSGVRRRGWTDKSFEVVVAFNGAESFNDWGGWGCRKFVPVLGEDSTKITPPGDTFYQPPGEMRSIWVKLADHVEDHAVLYTKGTVSMTTPGTKSSYPRPPQSLNDSAVDLHAVFPNRSGALKQEGKSAQVGVV